MAKVMTDFNSKKNGFYFSNKFKNVVFDNFLFSWTTSGRCGGMAYAALDYFYAGIPIPTHNEKDFPNGQVPGDDSMLGKYIYDRLITSLFANGLKFYSWARKLDHYTWAYDQGVPQLTKDEEFPKLMRRLENGPVPIGLMHPEGGLTNLGKNHQVVAYGAEIDDASGTMKVYVYDNNHPGREVVLTRGPSDTYFTNNIIRNDGSYGTYRGFFVEAYSHKTPQYIDLVISKNLYFKSLPCYLGDALEVGYSVKNVGEYASTISNLNIEVREPSGIVNEKLFSSDGNSTPIQPGEEREYCGKNNRSGTTLGEYRFKPQYSNIYNQAITNISGSLDALLNIYHFSERLLAQPPHVSAVSIAKASQGLTPSGFGTIDPNTIVKYTGQWEWEWEDGSSRRVFVSSGNEAPIVANRELYIFIRVSTSNFLGFPQSVKMKSISVKLHGYLPNGRYYTITPELHENSDDQGIYYWGSFKPENSFQTTYRLNIEISGQDAVEHDPTRNPFGDMLDSNPATCADIDLKNPPVYPFVNYEPGIDKNHWIQIAPLQKIINPDMCEINNSFDTATKKSLGIPDKSIGSEIIVPNLNIHTNTDVDYFKIDFTSLPEDATCDFEEPVENCFSEELGFYVTKYPPRIVINIESLDDCMTLTDIYASDNKNRSLISTIKSNQPYTINNPQKKFGDNSFYLAVKNPYFNNQGPATYSLRVNYLPMSQVLILKDNKLSHTKLYSARRKYLKRLLDVIDLPRPPLDLINKYNIYMDATNVALIDDFETFEKNFNKAIKDQIFLEQLQFLAPNEVADILNKSSHDLKTFKEKKIDIMGNKSVINDLNNKLKDANNIVINNLKGKVTGPNKRISKNSTFKKRRF